MYKRYLFFLLVYCFTYYGCSSSKNITEEAEVRVLKFTTQQWFGGRPGFRGENYEITILSNEVIQPDSLWINYRGCALSSMNNNSSLVTYNVGDTIVLKGTSRQKRVNTGDNFIPTSIVDSIKAPFLYDGEALFSFYRNGKINYKIIENVTEKEAIKYP